MTIYNNVHVCMDAPTSVARVGATIDLIWEENIHQRVIVSLTDDQAQGLVGSLFAALAQPKQEEKAA